MSEQKRRGPKAKHPEGFKELHLKFSGDLLKHIQQASGDNYQAYFDLLISREMKDRSRWENANNDLRNQLSNAIRCITALCLQVQDPLHVEQKKLIEAYNYVLHVEEDDFKNELVISVERGK